jgi:hypothetical protein
MSEPRKDQYGTPYSTPDNKAPTSWSPITIHNPDGTTSQGVWNGQATPVNKN